MAATAVLALAAAVRADPLDDAKAGLAALDKGDDAAAIRLFTQALDAGSLSRSDEELAHVKRAEAFLASGEAGKALADANRALDIDPRDAEAVAALGRAQAKLNPAPKAPVEPGASGASAYDHVLARYEAQKQADADAYAQRVAAYDAKVRAQETTQEAELAAWRADVLACKAGDVSKCGSAAQGGSAGAAQTAAASTDNPVAAAWFHSVYSGNTIIATLARPTSSRVKFIAADSAWDCAGTTCVASDAPDTAKSVDGCAALARQVGRVASYVADATALDTTELGRCDSQVSTASR
ncbi:MAG: CC_3452 family protein [Caulobacteraceae bacterium]